MNNSQDKLKTLYAQYDELNKKLRIARETKDHILYHKLLEQEGQLIQQVENLKHPITVSKQEPTASSADINVDKPLTAKPQKKHPGATIMNKIVSLFVKQFVGVRTFKEIYSTVDSNQTNREILEAIWKQAQGDVSWRFGLYSISEFDSAVMSHYRKFNANNDSKDTIVVTELQECVNMIHSIEHATSHYLTPTDLKVRGQAFRELLKQDAGKCKTEMEQFIKRTRLDLDYDKATDTSAGMQLSLL